MYNPFSLENKKILVTGASSGIGRATAIECSKLGARVILTARNEERLKETLSLMEGEGHQYLIADFNEPSAVDELVAQLPQLDSLVLNAGVNKLAPVQFIKEEDLMKVLRVNSIAPMMLVKTVLKKKKIAKGGSIVFTSSISGNYTIATAHSYYSVSKAAVSAFMMNAAKDLGAKGIRCNAVCPGMVETNLIHNAELSEEDLKEDMRNYPLGRYGQPKDVAMGIVYLLSDASSWVTGTRLVIDGGFTLR